MLRDLTEGGLWNEEVKNAIIANNGSIQVTTKISNVIMCLKSNLYFILYKNIESIPSDTKALYKTVWEIPQRVVIQMAADRGAFIDQSQSLNIHIAEPNYGKLTSMHFYAWKLVKSSSVYLV